jgi:hypothetical protein
MKRAREDEDEDPDKPQSKVLRALHATLKWMGPKGYEAIDWACSTKVDGAKIQNPITYHEAVNYPEWGHM